jgi:HNH endonuclease
MRHHKRRLNEHGLAIGKPDQFAKLTNAAKVVTPVLLLCGCGRMSPRRPCAECAAARNARRRAHTDRRHRPFRLAILERDCHVCHWCGEQADTVDYLQALALGGTAHDEGNAVAACRSCNSRRGALIAGASGGDGRRRGRDGRADIPAPFRE